MSLDDAGVAHAARSDPVELIAGLSGPAVAMELVRHAELAERPLTLHHYRDQRQREVDVVAERHSGEIAGIEVKAGATPRSADFAGLRYLRDSLGSRFKAGALIYTGSQTLPFGDRLAAVPVSGLWRSN